MKELVLDRLRKIEDLEQRKLLKAMVTDVFLNLVEYQEKKVTQLEERLFNELEDWEDKHDIYVTLLSREDIDPIHDWLYPMIPEDVEKNNNHFNMDELHAALNQKEEVKLLTIFLQSDYQKLRLLLDHKREFHGTMETTNGRYAITIRLDQSKVYIEEIEKLYKVFQMNGLPWKTINHPYAYKFFDVTLMRGPELKDDEEIVKCVFDLEEFEQDKQFDKIPLWNIERLAMKTVGFPTPALDKVNYEHILSIRKTGTEHGYLVAASEEDQVRYIKRSNDELTIIAQKEQSGVWELIKISQPMKIDKSPEEYEVVSNRRINNFVTKYAQKHTPTIRSRGEISRMINSFEAAKDIELDEVTLLDAQEECNEVSYPMNPFISDSIRVEQDKKIMLLHFKAMTEKQFYCNDTLSFLVSEVQMHFPEYKCRGTWV